METDSLVNRYRSVFTKLFLEGGKEGKTVSTWTSDEIIGQTRCVWQPTLATLRAESMMPSLRYSPATQPRVGAPSSESDLATRGSNGRVGSPCSLGRWCSLSPAQLSTTAERSNLFVWSWLRQRHRVRAHVRTQTA